MSLIHGQAEKQPIEDYAGRTVGAEAQSCEEESLIAVGLWMEEHELSCGEIYYNLVDDNGEVLALIDLAWPNGIQNGLTEPVALLLDETAETQQIVNAAGYRFFTTVESFKMYVEHTLE